MGGSCDKSNQELVGPRGFTRAPKTVWVWLDGDKTQLPRDVRVGKLLGNLSLPGRRPIVGLKMGDLPLNVNRTLWEEGVRQEAELFAVTQPARAEQCSHVALEVGEVCDEGYLLFCPDCEHSAPVALDNHGGKAHENHYHLSDATKKMIRRWKWDKSVEAMQRCRHPRDTIMWNDKRDFHWFVCAKCGADPAASMRLVTQREKEWVAQHPEKPEIDTYVTKPARSPGREDDYRDPGYIRWIRPK